MLMSIGSSNELLPGVAPVTKSYKSQFQAFMTTGQGIKEETKHLMSHIGAYYSQKPIK